jgi:hypothetical protein
MARLCKNIDSRLKSLGFLMPYDFCNSSPSLLFPLGVDPLDVNFGGPSYIDDNSTLLMHRNPRTLLNNVIDTIPIILDTSIEHGFQPNLDEGKSEILIKFRGKGAQEVTMEVFQTAKPFISFTSRMLGDRALYIVPSVKLLGVKQNADGNFDNELHHRYTGGQVGITEIARPLQSRRISVRAKIKLIKSLVFSRAFYCSGSWHHLNSHKCDRLRSFYTYAARSAIGKKSYGDTHFSNAEIFPRYPGPGDFIDFDSYVICRRLRYFKRFWDSAPQFLQTLVHYEFLLNDLSWLAQVQADLTWLVNASFSSLLPCVSPFCPTSWHNYYKDGASFFDVTLWNACTLRHDLDNTKQEVNVVPPVSDEFICHICSKSYPTRFSLYGHLARTHKQRNQARLHIHHNQCPACLKQFHDRRSIIQHVLYGKHKKCHDLIIENIVPMTEHECIDLDREVDTTNKNMRIGVGPCAGTRVPCRRAAGPLPRWCFPDH